MRIVVKVGTNVLTQNTRLVQEAVIKQLITEIFTLRSAGHEVVLVSSGAVGMGRAQLPKFLHREEKQILAAIGQPRLLQAYAKYAAKFEAEVAQLLILRSEVTDRERYENLISVLEGMLEGGVLPVINGNDVISKADLVTGDNDLLAAMVAIAVAADKLVILTNQPGFYTANPTIDKNAELIAEVKNVDFELERLCAGPKSSGGRGGMLSKIRAAKQAVHAGIETLIVDGREKDALAKALAEPHIGTRFKAQGSRQLSPQKRWLMAAKGFGQLVVDDGAVKALRNNKSLLLPGLISSRGIFDKTEIVEIVDKKGVAVAYGKTNYGHKEVQNAINICKAMGQCEILKEIVHCDHMNVLKE